MRLVRWLLRVCTALGVLLVVVMTTPLVYVWAHHLSGPLSPKDGKTLIVLGAAYDDEEGNLAYSSYWRAHYAVIAWRLGHFSRVIVSGGLGPQPASKSMAEYMEHNGISKELITVEGRSSSTHENALYTAKLLGGDTDGLVLLTSDFHMWRAQRAFLKAGLKTESWPVPDAVKRSEHWPGRWGSFQDLVVESVKIAGYKVRGWI